MDDTFGGVIIGNVEPSVIVAVSNRPGPSGYSGYSGSGGGSGGGGSSFSGYSGKSGFSGPGGGSGFSGFSARSGFSGYSGVIGNSGFSGYSGASGISGPGGGNSGYSGYSGADGTFSASGFSGYSGFSARSGFSGYSGSGVSGFSGYSGFSGQSISGFSGFSGFGQSGFSGFSSQSGFSGFSGKSGFSGGPSGFSGFSGTGSPSGGSAGDYQYNDGSGGFAGSTTLTTDGLTNNFATDTRFFFQNSSDPTKQVRFDASSLPSGSIVAVVVGGNSVTVIPNPASGSQFVTGINSTGTVQKAQPTFANIAGLVNYGQLDRSTTVVVETGTLTIAANTKVKSSASGTLTTIAFSGGDNAQQGRRLDLDITGGPYTLNIPACRRIGETGTITTLQVFAGYNEFSWEYINGEYVLSDSVSSGASGGGTSGYSGFSGRSGYSGFSGAGTSGFSGFSGPGSSGFSGYSAPNILTFSTKTDTDYTLVLGDANTGINMSSASPHTLTVPLNTSVAFPIGTQIPVEQGGTGLVTISPAVGVTLQGATTTSGLYSVVVLIKQLANTWLVAKSGASGYSGYSGGTGAIGSSGFSGFSGGGTSGFSGFSGAGTSGYSGYSSVSGFSGFSGRSGYSGFSGPQLLSFTSQVDTDYTLVLGDANTGVKMTSTPARTLTIPTNASVAFPVGTQIPIEQGGSGVITIAGAVGVTVQGATATAGQYSMVVLIKQGTDTWLASTGNSGYSGYSGYSGGSGYSGFSAFSGFSGTFGWTKLTVSGADVTTTGQTLVDVTGLVTGTLTASTRYEVHAVLNVGTSAVTTGTNYGLHGGGTGATAVINAIIAGTSTSAAAIIQTLNADGSTPGTNFLTASSISGVIEIRGWVTTRSTGTPTISVQHLKVTSGTSTVRIGSYLEYRLA